MSTVELNPRPVRVSPLIKFGRWTFLSLGIVYGVIKHNRYSKKEEALRAIEEQERPAREARLAEEKKRAAAAEIKMLEDLTKGIA